jgi:hypothetical protein
MSIKNLDKHYKSFYNSIDENLKYLYIITPNNIENNYIVNESNSIYNQIHKNIMNLNNFTLFELNYIKKLEIEQIKNLVKIYNEWFYILNEIEKII